MNSKTPRAKKKKIYVMTRYSRYDGTTDTMAYFLSFKSANTRWNKLAKVAGVSAAGDTIKTPYFIYEVYTVSGIV